MLATNMCSYFGSKWCSPPQPTLLRLFDIFLMSLASFILLLSLSSRITSDSSHCTVWTVDAEWGASHWKSHLFPLLSCALLSSVKMFFLFHQSLQYQTYSDDFLYFLMVILMV